MAQDETTKSTLDKGLDQTFPASDPVSATYTSVPKGTASPDPAIKPPAAIDAPLVDQALSEKPASSFAPEEASSEEMEALRADVRRLSAMVKETAAAGYGLAQSEIELATERARDSVRAEPLKSILIAAGIGYLLGRIA